MFDEEMELLDGRKYVRFGLGPKAQEEVIGNLARWEREGAEVRDIHSGPLFLLLRNEGRVAVRSDPNLRFEAGEHSGSHPTTQMVLSVEKVIAQGRGCGIARCSHRFVYPEKSSNSYRIVVPKSTRSMKRTRSYPVPAAE
jgi:hypothetical protein